MKVYALLANVAALLMLSSTCALSQGINPVKCELAEGGKRIRILGSNPSGVPLTCTAAKCEAPAQGGSTRICDLTTTVTLQPGAANVELASCFNDDNAAHPPLSESHSCH
jgi:hypothetical protein